MIDFSERKKEIFKIYSHINLIEDQDEKNTICAVTFPRIYSHYEKYVEESFLILLSEMYSENPKLSEINSKIVFLLTGLFSLSRNNEGVIKIANQSKDNLEYLKKETLESVFKHSNIHLNIIELIEIFALDSHPKIGNLKVNINTLKSKYRSRCNIAHGSENIEEMKFQDWVHIKEKIMEIFDLIDEIFFDYIENKKFLRERQKNL